MGTNEKSTFTERKLITAIASACSIAGLILCATALGTDGWISTNGSFNGSSNASFPDPRLSVKYGLFKGVKQLDAGLSANTYHLQFVCSSADNACMWSCAASDKERQTELQQILKRNFTGLPSCFSVVRANVPRTFNAEWRSFTREAGDATSFVFMDFGLWVATIFFLCLALLFLVVSSLLSVLNVVTNPIEVWTGPWGIYVSNALAIFSSILTLALWGGQYGTNLSVNVAVRETLTGDWTQEGATLGYSFWLVFAAALLAIVSCVCVRFRNALRKPGTANLEEEEPTNTGVVLLF